jgi:hypothetical protein
MFSDRVPNEPVPPDFYSALITRRKAQKSEKERRDEFMSNVVLSDKDIASVLAGSRKRGDYREALETFVASGNKGERIDVEAGPFQGKSLTALYQSFVQNAKTHASNVRVVKNDEGVYLINTDLV